MVPGLELPELIDGRFRVEALLGHGGMGAVLRVFDTLRGHAVALKILNLPSGSTERAQLHFQQEFAALRRLRHPNVPQVYDYGALRAGLPYFTMELVEGADLAQLVPLPLDRFYAVVTQLAQTLAFVHSRRVVHRDIKTSNVRVTLDPEGWPERVILLDFGLVSPFDAAGGRVMGTLSHLPPEAFHGGELGTRSDLYSLGVLMYECLTGELPRVSRPRAGATQRVSSTYLDLSALSGFPPALARLLRSMLAASPSLRPGSADAVLEEMERLSGTRASELSEEQKRSYLASPALVGRGPQMQALRDAEQRCRDQQVDVVLLSAVSGEGKSRLLDEFVLEVQVTGARVLRAVCSPEARSPFGPLVEALAPLMAAAAARRDPTLLEVAPHLVRLSEALARALPEVVPSVPLPDRDADLLRILDALEGLLRGASRDQLILLVLDDLQWADGHTLDFVARMMERRGASWATLLVGAVRADELHEAPALAQMLRLNPGVELRLGPLERGAVVEMLRKQFAVDEPPPELVTVLLSQTGGNPYLLHATLRYLVDEGQIRHAQGGWVLPDRVEDIVLPAELSDVILARLGRCPADAKDAAELLALAGRGLDSALLAGVVQTERPLGELLQDLLDQDIVAWDGDSVRLAHAFMQDRLRGGLGPERTQALHLRLAQAMEQARAVDPDGYAEAEVGRHLQLGGEPRRALPLLLGAGRRALDLQAQEEAVQVLTWAAEIQAMQPYFPGEGLDQTQITILRMLFTMDPAACAALAEQVLQRMTAVGSIASIYRWRPWLGSLAVRLGVVLTLLALRRQRPGLPVDAVRTFYGMIVIAAVFRTISVAWMGRFRDAQRVLREVAAPLLPKERPELGALSDAGMCVVLTQQGRTEEALARLMAAQAVLEGPAGQNVPAAERHLASFGGVTIGVAALNAARGLPDALGPVTGPEVTRHPNHTLFLEASTILASSQFHAQRGELAQLEQEIARVRQLRVTLRPQSHEIVTRSLSWALIEAGHFERAQAHLAELRHMGTYSDATRLLLEARLPGPLPDRVRLLERVRALAQDPQMDSLYLVELADLAEAEARLGAGQPRGAVAQLDAALVVSRAAPTRNEYIEAVALRLRAEVALALREPSAPLAEEAWEAAARLRNPLLTALASLTLAQAVVEDDPERAEELMQGALEQLERLGNQHQLRRALDLRRRIGQVGTFSAFAGVAPGLDPHHLSHSQLARLTWSLDLTDVAEGLLAVLGELCPGSRRWVWIAASADNGELLLGQEPGGALPSAGSGLPEGLLDELRQAPRREADRLGYGELWGFPLTRGQPPGGGGVAPAPYGQLLVLPAPRVGQSDVAMRELAPRVRALAGLVHNALEYARLAQREYRLSMVNQLSQLLGSVRTSGQIVALVLDRLLDITGADRAALLLMDERSGSLRLEMARDLGRTELPVEGLELEEAWVERALSDQGVVELPDAPARLIAASTAEAPRCRGVLVALRSLLRDQSSDDEEMRRRRDSLVTLSMPELTTIGQSDSGGQVVGVIWLETDRQAGGLMPVDGPLLSMLASQAGFALDVARLDRQLEEEAREQEALKAQRAQLERYLSKEVAQAVLADPGLNRLGARRAVVTVVFTDIRGFTQWSESLPSDRVVHTLNEVFSLITPILFRHGGTLDKYLGDGLMAIFGAPVELPDHALRAVLAAREMQEALNAWLKSQEPKGRRIPGMGIGVHTGEVSVGNIGSVERMEYTAIGDVVNVSSRICGLAAPGQVLLSDATLAAMPIGAFLTRKLELVQVKGRKDPVQLFEVL